MLVKGPLAAIVARDVAVEIGLARTCHHDQVHAAGPPSAIQPLYHYLDKSSAAEAALISPELHKMKNSCEMYRMCDAGWERVLADAHDGS